MDKHDLLLFSFSLFIFILHFSVIVVVGLEDGVGREVGVDGWEGGHRCPSYTGEEVWIISPSEYEEAGRGNPLLYRRAWSGLFSRSLLSWGAEGPGPTVAGGRLTWGLRDRDVLPRGRT